MKKRVIQLSVIFFLSGFTLLWGNYPEPCGTCEVSSNAGKNTKECVACADGSGDVCISDSGSPKCSG